MKDTLLKIAFACCVLLTQMVRSQPAPFNTIAGQPNPGAVNATANQALFNHPTSLAVDASGNIYIADTQNGTIRQIGTNKLVSTFAGSAGNFGSLDANGTNAQFYAPQGIAAGGGGILYVADTGNATIRKIAANGAVSTLAGSPGNANSFDGTGTNANFSQPRGLAVDNANNVYVADALNNTIRKITPAGVVTTLAGLAGYPGSIDSTNSRARFNKPAGIAVDSATNLFVTDSLNHTIRKITPTGNVTTIAGLPGVWGNTDGTNSAARFFQPQGIVADNAGNLFVVDSGNHVVRKISPSGTDWTVTTVAGSSGDAGNANGSGDVARFYFPVGLAKNNSGYLYVADSGNNTIRLEGFELRSLSTLPDGRRHFTLNGKPSLNYAIEGSTDLVIWPVVTNLSSADGILEFVESSPSDGPRFYRARLAP